MQKSILLCIEIFSILPLECMRPKCWTNIAAPRPRASQEIEFLIFRRKNDAERGRQPPEIFYVYKYIESMSKLIGAQYTSPPQLVRVQFTGLSNFVKWLDDARPTKRKSSAASNDLHFEYGLLYPDAALLNASSSGCANTSATFAVEIKPKQGWHVRQLPDDVLKMFGVERGAIDKCRFCSMQFLKVSEDAMRIVPICEMELTQTHAQPWWIVLFSTFFFLISFCAGATTYRRTRIKLHVSVTSVRWIYFPGKMSSEFNFERIKNVERERKRNKTRSTCNIVYFQRLSTFE